MKKRQMNRDGSGARAEDADERIVTCTDESSCVRKRERNKDGQSG